MSIEQLCYGIGEQSSATALNRMTPMGFAKAENSMFSRGIVEQRNDKTAPELN